jgi:hypothetical protein
LQAFKLIHLTCGIAGKDIMANRIRTLLMIACFSIPFEAGVAASETNGNGQDAFVQGCLKSKGAKPAECECMYRETSGRLPAEEAAFLIASMDGNMTVIQETAAKLSPEQITAALSSSWLGIVDKCLTE